LASVQQPVPIIYAIDVANRRQRLSVWGRLLAAGVALACLSVLVTAASLRPSPTGVGSHQRIGLQSCAFLDRTGLPCPSCGMTTSYTWMVRGNLLASFYVQPMGAVLALLTGAAFWAGLYIVLTGRPAHRLLRLVPSGYYLVPLFTWAIVAWTWKIFIHLRGIDGWR
jgi:hypothetical protein